MKIGVARVPSDRLAQLQTGNPDQLRLVWSLPIMGDAYAVEAEAHAMLDRHRISGEWFAVPADIAVAAISGAAYRLVSPQDSSAKRNVERLSWPVRWILAIGVPFIFWTFAFGPAPTSGCAFLLLSCFALLWRARKVPEIWPRPLATRAFFALAVPALFFLAAWPGATVAEWLGYHGTP